MKQDIIDYLVSNQEHLKEVIAPFKDLMNIQTSKEDAVWLPLINTQYKESVKSAIITDVTQSLAVDYESVSIILDDINLEDYFNV